MATAKFEGTQITIDFTPDEAELFAWVVSMWGPTAPIDFFISWLESRRQLRRELLKEQMMVAYEALPKEDQAGLQISLGVKP
jgi:hypothetical protein